MGRGLGSSRLRFRARRNARRILMPCPPRYTVQSCRACHREGALGWASAPFAFSLSGAWRQTAHWHVQGRVGRALSPRGQVVTQKSLRRKVRHASHSPRPCLANGVAERPGHRHVRLAEASSSPWRASDDERGVDDRTPRDADSCEDPGQ